MGEPRTPGQLVADKYRLERLVDEGGMGQVWAAEHVVTKRRLALKFLKDDATDEGARKRFLLEARASCAVEHPAVVPVMDVLELGGELALVMELLSGESLAARLARDGRLAARETARLLLPVAEALAAAHALGIVHRDLKPSNIFITSSGQTRLLDFGIAKLVSVASEATQGTASGTAIGTPRYMSPEQAFGEKDVDAKTDVWSLGLVLYQCLSGALPTEADSFGKIVKILLSDAFPPLGPLAPGASAGLVAMVERMLVRDRAERGPTLEEVAIRLRAEAGSSTLPAAPPDAAAVRGGPRLRVLSALLALATLGGLTWTWLALRGRPQPVGEPPADTVAPVPSSAEPPSNAEGPGFQAFLAGRRLQREARWAEATGQLKSAVELDPSLAAAHLQLAIAYGGVAGYASAEARAAYRQAIDLRLQLSERDLALALALEPLLAREPAQPAAALAALDALCEQHPDDAELLATTASVAINAAFTTRTALARRAVELDPGYADAWQTLSASEAREGNLARALEAVEACHKASPNSSDCVFTKLQILDFEGRCDEMEAVARRAPFAVPNWPYVLVRLGRDPSSVRDAFQRATREYPPEISSLLEQNLLVSSAIARGDVKEGRRAARVAVERAGALDGEGWPLLAATAQAQIAAEGDDLLSAVAAAEAALSRRGNGALPSQLTADQSYDLAAFAHLARRPGLDSLQSERARFQRRWSEFRAGSPTLFWAATAYPEVYWSAKLERPAPELARERLSEMPARLDPYEFLAGSQWQFTVGIVLEQAGRHEEALPWLERTTSACSGWIWPGWLLEAHLALGRASAALGHKEQACRAFGFVSGLFTAEAPARSARRARQEAAAIACPR